MKTPLTTLEQAKHIIKSHTKPLKTEHISLTTSIGRTISENIVATIDQQPFDNSAMDGYAIDSKYTQNASKNNPSGFEILPYIIKAGNNINNIPNTKSQPVTTKIMTGAAIPNTFNTVIPVEDAIIVQNKLLVTKPYSKFYNVRQKGEDFKIGSILASQGSIVTPHIALLLKTSGINTIPVYKKPKIGVITSGTEFNKDNSPLMEGKIYNSNSTFLISFLNKLNFEVIYLGNIEDNIQQLKNLIEVNLNKLDIIVSSGGISKGDFDIIPEVLKSYGSILYHFVSIKPGKPNLLVKLNNGTLWFGLPGNPVSTAVGAKIFLEYYSLCINNNKQNIFYAKLIKDITKKPMFTLFNTGIMKNIKGELWVEINKKQGSHIISSLAHSNVLVELEAHKDFFPAGTLVPIHILNNF